MDWGSIAQKGLEGLGATGSAALAMWAVRKIGGRAKAKENEERLFKRVIVSVTQKQNGAIKGQGAGMRAVVEINRDNLNGSYDSVMGHLDEADKNVEEADKIANDYLVQTSLGEKR